MTNLGFHHMYTGKGKISKPNNDVMHSAYCQIKKLNDNNRLDMTTFDNVHRKFSNLNFSDLVDYCSDMGVELPIF